MIAWDAIKLALKNEVILLAGLPPAQVKWRDESEGSAWGNVPIIYLSRSFVGAIGFTDERRSAPAGDVAQDQIVDVVQQVTFGISLKCESFDQDIASGKNAMSILGGLKTRLRRSTSVFSRDGIFAILTYQDVADATYTSQGRRISCAVLDLLCGTVDSDTDTSAGAGGFINRVIGTGTAYETPGTVTLPLDAEGS